jgi:hypothetical protein
MKNSTTHKKALLIKIVGAVAAAFFYFPILSQKFWMLDDHTFVGWYGNKSTSTIQNFLKFLLETNFGDFGQSTRFTPTQDLFFVVRTLILPNDPLYWYVINYIIIIGLFLLAIKILEDFLKLYENNYSLLIQIAATALVLLGLCNSVAARVYGRLGTGESIAVLFLLLSLRSMQRIKISPNSKFLWFQLLSYQGLLVGSKENYVWLIGAYIFWVMTNIKSSKKYNINLVLVYVLISFVQTMIILLGILPGILRGGQNVYGRSISIDVMVDAILIMLGNKFTSLVIILCLLCSAILVFQKKDTSFILIASVPVLFLVFDQVYYQGIIVDHYLTNKVIATVWICAVAIKMIITEDFFRKNLLYVVPFMLVIANYYYFQNGYDRIQEHKKATIAFANGLDEVANSKNDYSQVAFIAQSAWDYESIFSTIKQLRGRGDVRPYFLLISKKFESSNDPILPIFSEWSKNGLPVDLYSPVSQLDSNKQMICYYSESAPIPEEQCEENIVIKWLP